jgi:hypothetical protein
MGPQTRTEEEMVLDQPVDEMTILLDEAVEGATRALVAYISRRLRRVGLPGTAADAVMVAVLERNGCPQLHGRAARQLVAEDEQAAAMWRHLMQLVTVRSGRDWYFTELGHN